MGTLATTAEHSSSYSWNLLREENLNVFIKIFLKRQVCEVMDECSLACGRRSFRTVRRDHPKAHFKWWFCQPYFSEAHHKSGKKRLKAVQVHTDAWLVLATESGKAFSERKNDKDREATVCGGREWPGMGDDRSRGTQCAGCLECGWKDESEVGGQSVVPGSFGVCSAACAWRELPPHWPGNSAPPGMNPRLGKYKGFYNMRRLGMEVF